MHCILIFKKGIFHWVSNFIFVSVEFIFGKKFGYMMKHSQTMHFVVLIIIVCYNRSCREITLLFFMDTFHTSFQHNQVT